MLYIIGLGLGDEKDITLRGLEAVRRCDKVYIEAYTSLLSFGISSDGLSKLVSFYESSVLDFFFFFSFLFNVKMTLSLVSASSFKWA